MTSPATLTRTRAAPRQPKATRHLLIRTACEIGKLERFHGYCGANGTVKRDYRASIADVDCPMCLTKLKGKRKLNG
jgi:hypothetical protein